jgi:hypothetical protein
MPAELGFGFLIDVLGCASSRCGAAHRTGRGEISDTAMNHAAEPRHRFIKEQTNRHMKSLFTKCMLTTLTAAALSISVFAEETVRTTTTATTSMGTISEFSPDTITVRSTSVAEPIRYRYTKTTTYVDEAGAPVSVELVKSGLPVTVHYVREGDQLVASRVIVRKAVAPAPSVIEKKTTTTTTTTDKDDDDEDDD